MFWFYFSLACLAALLAVIAQIVLKRSADAEHKSLLSELVNVRTVVGYGLFTISFCVTTLSYKGVPLYLVPIVDSFSYILVLVMGHFFLNDLINWRKTSGIALIVVGIIIFKMGDIIAAIFPETTLLNIGAEAFLNQI